MSESLKYSIKANVNINLWLVVKKKQKKSYSNLKFCSFLEFALQIWVSIPLHHETDYETDHKLRLNHRQSYENIFNLRWRARVTGSRRWLSTWWTWPGRCSGPRPTSPSTSGASSGRRLSLTSRWTKVTQQDEVYMLRRLSHEVNYKLRKPKDTSSRGWS